MSSKPDFNNPATWESAPNAAVGDIYRVTGQDEINSKGVYRAGDYYKANFAGPLGSKWYPPAGKSDDNWTFQKLGCTDLTIKVNGGVKGAVFANGRNQTRVSVSWKITAPAGPALPDEQQKAVRVSLVRSGSGQALDGYSGWRVSDTPGDFATPPATLRESAAVTVNNGVASTDLYLSHDDNNNLFDELIAPRVQLGSSIFDDVNGGHSGTVITVTPLTPIIYQLSSGNCEKGQKLDQDGGSHDGYSSRYSHFWVQPVDPKTPFTHVEVRTGASANGNPPPWPGDEHFKNCITMAWGPNVMGYEKLICMSFCWPTDNANGGQDARDLGLGPYVRVTPVQGAANMASITQQHNWGTDGWPGSYMPQTVVCRASDAWGNCGYFRLYPGVEALGVYIKDPDILDASKSDFNALPG